MATTQGRPAVDFDHLRPAAERHPWHMLEELRETCPVAWSNHYDGFWIVSKHDDAAKALRDPSHFSSSRDLLADPEQAMYNIPSHRVPPHYPVELDPPNHLKYRRLLNESLSPAAVELVQPRVDHWTTVFLDRVIERGTCDFSYDLGSPVPAAITLEWLGLPPEHAERVSYGYHDYLGYIPGTEEHDRALETLKWLPQLISDALEDRRSSPRDDRLTWIANSQIDGAPMPLDKAVGMIGNLIGGGVETTSNGVVWGLLHLQRHPEDRRRLADHPELWDNAVDEIVRLYPPLTYIARTVRDGVVVRGCPMTHGERVMIALASACHDEEAFPEASRLNFDRPPNKHVAFGSGAHRCAGIHLARREMKTMLQQVLDRMPDYQIDEAAAAQYPVQGTIAGWRSLPATFTPGKTRLKTPES